MMALALLERRLCLPNPKHKHIQCTTAEAETFKTQAEDFSGCHPLLEE